MWKEDKGGGVMYKKHKIPKKIVDKIKQRNKLNKEIEKWCNENLDMDGMCSLYADIRRSKFGDEQGTEDCKEQCAQSQIGEDTFYGDYFWETEYPRQYLHMEFHA